MKFIEKVAICYYDTVKKVAELYTFNVKPLKHKSLWK